MGSTSNPASGVGTGGVRVSVASNASTSTSVTSSCAIDVLVNGFHGHDAKGLYPVCLEESRSESILGSAALATREE